MNELENTRRRNKKSVAGPNTTRELSEEGYATEQHRMHPHGEVDKPSTLVRLQAYL